MMSQNIDDFWRDTFLEMLQTCVENSGVPKTEFDEGYKAGLRSIMKIISTQAVAFEVDISSKTVNGVSLDDWLGDF